MNALPPSDITADTFDEDRFAAIERFAETQVSLWTSVREAAWRRELETLELHCPQIRILTKATFETVKTIRAGEKADAA